MVNVLKMQLNVIFSRKSTIVMYILMCGLVIANFLGNVSTYAGYNYWNMYHPMRLVFLGDYSLLGFSFIQYYPFLVVIPAAFTYFSDKNSKELLFIQTRTDKKNYYIGTMIAIFITTFIVFTVPQLLELGLNSITFPLDALGEQSNQGLFENVDLIQHYLFYELWILNPYLYTFVMIILFGVVSGCLACFASVFSMLGFLKFRVLIFIPVYVLLYGISMLKELLSLDFETNYYFYLRFFCYADLNEVAYLSSILVILAISGVTVFFKMRRDELS